MKSFFQFIIPTKSIKTKKRQFYIWNVERRENWWLNVFALKFGNFYENESFQIRVRFTREHWNKFWIKLEGLCNNNFSIKLRWQKVLNETEREKSPQWNWEGKKSSISLDLMVDVVGGGSEERDHLLLGVLQRPAVFRHLQRLPLGLERLQSKRNKNASHRQV